MKIALSFPTTVQLVEKVGAIFKEIHLIGFNGEYADNENRYHNDEFEKLGIKIHYHPEPYDDLNPKDFDLLIDSWETRVYRKEWREESLRWNIPTILKVLWFAYPKEEAKLTEDEISKLNKSVVSTENYVLADRWKSVGLNNVEVLLYPPGNWWFENEWIGEDDRILYILSGVGKYRDVVSTGFDLWNEIELALPNKTYHQDGQKNYISSMDLSLMVKKFRCYTNLDRGLQARPLCLVFTEALSAGIPPLIIRRGNVDYHRYIENGVSGYICDDLHELIEKTKVLLRNHDLAKGMSIETRNIAKKHFSEDVLKPKWDAAIRLAQKVC